MHWIWDPPARLRIGEKGSIDHHLKIKKIIRLKIIINITTKILTGELEEKCWVIIKLQEGDQTEI